MAGITAFLTDHVISERVLDGRVEAFSCKRAGEDKKLMKKLEQQYNEEIATSPCSFDSPLGALSDSSSRRLLIDLISTLNASFPDYDFSSLRPDQFTKELGFDFVLRSINRHLAEFTQPFLDELWAAIEDSVVLNECDVYSYVPDLDSDPFSSDGILWSFNYFFFNKNLKRIVYFTCVARPYERHDFYRIEDDECDPLFDDEPVIAERVGSERRLRFQSHRTPNNGSFADDDYDHADDDMDDDDL